VAAVRETILLRIKTAVETITIANGYNENVGTVYFDAQILEEVAKKDLPAIVVLPGDETREQFAIGTASNNMQARCPMLIGGILFHHTGITQGEVEDLILDVNKAVMADTTLAGYCLTIEPGMVSTNMDAAPGFATFEQTWDFTYLYTRSTGG